MSCLTKRKQERELLALRSAYAGRFGDAFRHAGEAARCGYLLAEQTDGETSRAYLKDADAWAKLAARLKNCKNAPDENALEKIALEKNALEKNAARQEPNADSKENDGAAKSSPWLTKERPTERFADVAGLDDVKRVVFSDVIDAAKHADLYREMKVESGGGALTYGPPGNGKTLIARAIAGELDAAFFAVSGALIKDKYVGETEKNMRRLFEEASRYPRAVVFIDEIHSALARRGREKASAVDEFLVMTDGFEKRKNTLLLLGATNYPWLLDPAVFRRMKNLIYVGPPDQAARKKIFDLQFKGVPVEAELPTELFAEKTEGFSGADLARIATAAKKNAIRRAIDSGASSAALTFDDVNAAIETTKPTVSAETIAQYREWEKAFYGGEEFNASEDCDE